jgi:hypothetical protein
MSGARRARPGAPAGAAEPGNEKGAASPPRLPVSFERSAYWAPNELVSILKPGPIVDERLIFLM